MTSAPPPFLLTREQAMRLRAYIQVYRQYTMTALFSSTERNATLRMLQTVRGKVFETMDQPTTPLQLVLSGEEMATLKATVTELLALYARQPESKQRVATLADLAALKNSLKAY